MIIKVLVSMRRHLLFCAVFACMVLSLGACASSNRTIHLGPGGRWDQIEQSGISGDASYIYFVHRVNVHDDTTSFTPDSAQATYWAKFKINAFAGYKDISFQAVWTAPSGDEFHREDFAFGFAQKMFAKTHMQIKGTPAANLSGVWTVKIYHAGQMIDEKQFHITDADGNLPYLAAPPPIKQMAPQESTAAVENNYPSSVSVPLPDSGEEKAFRAAYDEARQLFQNERYGEAEKILEDLLVKQPYRTEAHFALGMVHYHLENWEQALTEFDYAVQHPVYRDQAMRMRSRILSLKESS